MAKYDPLKNYLDTLEVELSIEQLDKILADVGGLSDSLRKLDSRAWQNPGITSSVQARSWIDAGFKVDRLTKTGVVFKRAPIQS